jgi:dTDP-glucose 4,6-dehydratase/UDP-glucuronate decarboxylase
MSTPPIPALEELLARDLRQVVEDLREELSELAGKRLLITGGAGFLGYYLVHAALHFNATVGRGQPIEVSVWDNFARGEPSWMRSLSGTPQLRVEARDLTQPLPDPMPDFSYVIHAAGIASPPFYRRHPIQTIDANVTGLRNLLEFASARVDTRRPVEGFLFFSSSEIYGDPPPDCIPTPETFRGLVSCTGPRACYDESKRLGETLCVVFAQERGVPTKIARPFNNYGPGLKITDRRVVPDLARDVLAGRDIVLWSDGMPTRTFCYASDAATGYYKVLVRGRPGEPYNIGTDRPEISIGELAETCRQIGSELLGYRGRVVRGVSPESDYLVDNPSRRCPDLAKATADLGYAPRVLVEDGLRRSLIWYHHNPSGVDA